MNIDGTPFSLRLLSMTNRPCDASAVTLRFAAKGTRREHVGELNLKVDSLLDADHVVDLVMESARAIIRGELQNLPGRHKRPSTDIAREARLSRDRRVKDHPPRQ